MILNPNVHQAESETLGVEESISMSIDTSDQAALMMILSENLYKDPIGSLIRESASNALDAHKEAGIEEPIIVALKMDGNYNYIYSVQDFGTGISPDRVTNILSKYAASTKRQSNDYLGYFGLGFKAPLAYTDSFIFITRYEGMEYKYMMYKGEEGTKIDLIDQQETTERNGTIVSIQLTKRTDVYVFESKIKEQLAYFEGVYFEVTGINNSFKVFKSEDWKFSELAKGKPMHICLENVYYEIDWQRLGIHQINLSIGLNFSISDGLLPIPSREDIKYTDEAKTLIINKINTVADYLVTKFNEGRVEADTFSEVYNKFNSKTVTIEGYDFDVSQLEKHTAIPFALPTVKGIKLLNLKQLSENTGDLFKNYEIRGRIWNRVFSSKFEETDFNLLRYQRQHTELIISEHTPKGLQLEYLKDKFPNAVFLYKKRDLFLGKTDHYNSWDDNYLTNYRNLLRLKQYPKSQWREVIKEFQTILNSILDPFPKLEDLQPTQDWLDERKANRAKGKRTTVSNEEITLKIARKAERGDNNLTFDPRVIAIKDIGKKLKSLIVYTTHEKKTEMDRLFLLIKRSNYKKPRVTLVILNRYDLKKVKDLSNFISMEEFMKGKTKPFKAFATAILISELESKYRDIFNSVDFISNLSSGLAQKMNFLSKYKRDNYPDGYISNDVIKGIREVAEKYNLFDEEVMLIYNEMPDKLEKLDFITVLNYSPHILQQSLEVAREILRHRKFRMDWENYLQLNPPVVPMKVEDEDEDPDEDPDDEEEEEENPDVEGDEIAQIGSVTSLVPVEEYDLPF